MNVQMVRSLVPAALRPSMRVLYRSLTGRTRSRPANASDPSVLHCRTAYNKYGGYCVPVSALHRPASRAILAGGVWEPQTIDFLTSRGNDSDLIHAGTFFGDFLPALARSRRGGAKVWAFEPNRESYRCASVTVAISGLENVVLTNAALGERREMATLQTSTPDGTSLGGGSRILGAEETALGADTVRVQVETIDATVPDDRTVSLIQLDVEGFETQALTGAISTIRRCLPVIVVETLPDEGWLAENLRPLGYRTGPAVEGNTVLLPPEKTV